MGASAFARRLGIGGRARRGRSTSMLLIAVGAVAGVAIGMVIADRVGGVEGLLRLGGGGSRKRRGAAGQIAGWRRDLRRSETFEQLSDDDSELSPESIAHMHVRGDRNPSSSRAEAASAEHARTGEWRGATRVRSGTVRPLPVRHAPDEAALEARVLEAFMNDPILRERAIDICASGTGTIELTGWVLGSSEIAHALTLARGVPDVSSVVDRLAVRGAEPARDHSGHRYAGPPPGSEAAPLRAD